MEPAPFDVVEDDVAEDDDALAVESVVPALAPPLPVALDEPVSSPHPTPASMRAGAHRRTPTEERFVRHKRRSLDSKLVSGIAAVHASDVPFSACGNGPRNSLESSRLRLRTPPGRRSGQGH